MNNDLIKKKEDNVGYGAHACSSHNSIYIRACINHFHFFIKKKKYQSNKRIACGGERKGSLETQIIIRPSKLRC